MSVSEIDLDLALRGLARPTFISAAGGATKTIEKLLRASASAVDPFNSPPLTVAADWVSGATVFVGSVRASVGNNYVAASGGVCGATAPTHINSSATSDGTVLWTYLGPVESTTADASAPNVYVSANTPGNYATSTALTVGQVIATSAGSRCWYVVTVAGTTAASGTGPTHTTGTATDGTVTFLFMGRFYTNSGQTVKFSPGSVGTAGYMPNAVTARGGYIYNNGGLAGVKTFNSNASTTVSQHFALEFETGEPAFYIRIQGNGQPVQLIVDGRRYSPGGIEMVSSSANYLYVSFPSGSRRKRVIRIEIRVGTQSFGDIVLSSYGSINAASRETVRAAFISDSILAGSGFGPFVTGGAVSQRVGHALGWADPWSLTVGGTGYVNPGSFEAYGYRVAEALTRNPDIWVLMGSTNDIGQTSSDITAAVLALLRSIRAGGSKAPIIVYGVWPINNATVSTVEAAVAAAVTQFADRLTFFVPMFADAATGLPWLTGAWNNTAGSGSLTASLLLGGDNIHPIDAGTAELSRRMVQAYRAQVLPALLAA